MVRSIVVESREVRFADCKDEIQKELGKGQKFDKAEASAPHIVVERFIYRSNRNNVVGYLVKPRYVKGKLPCIIRCRGGSGDFGMITSGSLFTSYAYFARHGYIVIGTQYAGVEGGQGFDDFGGMQTLSDVVGLREILADTPEADLSRIACYGASRGGMMTYLALAKVRWIKAAATVGGVSDLFDNAKRRPEMFQEVFKKRFGGTKKAMRERSALYFADKFSKKTPVLLLHGTADWRVHYLNSVHLSEKLIDRKVPCRLVLFEGADHDLAEYRKEAMDMTVAWFDRYVKDKNRMLPNMKSHGR